jgi:hypothetical protein
MSKSKGKRIIVFYQSVQEKLEMEFHECLKIPAFAKWH